MLKSYEVRGGAYCFLVTAWDRGDARREANRILGLPDSKYGCCGWQYIREVAPGPEDWAREARIWNRCPPD